MVSGHDSEMIDEEGAEHPGFGEPVGGFDDEEHEDHGHGHDDHAAGGDGWVIPPIVIGLIVGIIIAIVVGGTGAGVPTF